MLGRVVFEFVLAGDATQSDYEQSAAEAACAIADRLIGWGFTTNEEGLSSHSIDIEVLP